MCQNLQLHKPSIQKKNCTGQVSGESPKRMIMAYTKELMIKLASLPKIVWVMDFDKANISTVNLRVLMRKARY